MYFIIIQLISLFAYLPQSNVSCNITEVYSGQNPPEGTVVLSSFKQIEDIELILVPIKVKYGKYNGTVSRVSKDLYKLDGQDIYIRTSYCKKYSVSEKVIIKYTSSIGLSKGEIIFLE